MLSSPPDVADPQEQMPNLVEAIDVTTPLPIPPLPLSRMSMPPLGRADGVSGPGVALPPRVSLPPELGVMQPVYSPTGGRRVSFPLLQQGAGVSSGIFGQRESFSPSAAAAGALASSTAHPAPSLVQDSSWASALPLSGPHFNTIRTVSQHSPTGWASTSKRRGTNHTNTQSTIAATVVVGTSSGAGDAFQQQLGAMESSYLSSPRTAAAAAQHGTTPHSSSLHAGVVATSSQPSHSGSNGAAGEVLTFSGGFTHTSAGVVVRSSGGAGGSNSASASGGSHGLDPHGAVIGITGPTPFDQTPAVMGDVLSAGFTEKVDALLEAALSGSEIGEGKPEGPFAALWRMLYTRTVGPLDTTTSRARKLFACVVCPICAVLLLISLVLAVAVSPQLDFTSPSVAAGYAAVIARIAALAAAAAYAHLRCDVPKELIFAVVAVLTVAEGFTAASALQCRSDVVALFLTGLCFALHSPLTPLLVVANVAIAAMAVYQDTAVHSRTVAAVESGAGADASLDGPLLILLRSVPFRRSAAEFIVIVGHAWIMCGAVAALLTLRVVDALQVARECRTNLQLASLVLQGRDMALNDDVDRLLSGATHSQLVDAKLLELLAHVCPSPSPGEVSMRASQQLTRPSLPNRVATKAPQPSTSSGHSSLERQRFASAHSGSGVGSAAQQPRTTPQTPFGASECHGVFGTIYGTGAGGAGAGAAGTSRLNASAQYVQSVGSPLIASLAGTSGIGVVALGDHSLGADLRSAAAGRHVSDGLAGDVLSEAASPHSAHHAPLGSATRVHSHTAPGAAQREHVVGKAIAMPRGAAASIERVEDVTASDTHGGLTSASVTTAAGPPNNLAHPPPGAMNNSAASLPLPRMRRPPTAPSGTSTPVGSGVQSPGSSVRHGGGTWEPVAGASAIVYLCSLSRRVHRQRRANTAGGGNTGAPESADIVATPMEDFGTSVVNAANSVEAAGAKGRGVSAPAAASATTATTTTVTATVDPASLWHAPEASIRDFYRRLAKWASDTGGAITGTCGTRLLVVWRHPPAGMSIEEAVALFAYHLRDYSRRCFAKLRDNPGTDDTASFAGGSTTTTPAVGPLIIGAGAAMAGPLRLVRQEGAPTQFLFGWLRSLDAAARIGAHEAAFVVDHHIRMQTRQSYITAPVAAVTVGEWAPPLPPAAPAHLRAQQQQQRISGGAGGASSVTGRSTTPEAGAAPSTTGASITDPAHAMLTPTLAARGDGGFEAYGSECPVVVPPTGAATPAGRQTPSNGSMAQMPEFYSSPSPSQRPTSAAAMASTTTDALASGDPHQVLALLGAAALLDLDASLAAAPAAVGRALPPQVPGGGGSSATGLRVASIRGGDAATAGTTDSAPIRLYIIVERRRVTDDSWKYAPRRPAAGAADPPLSFHNALEVAVSAVGACCDGRLAAGAADLEAVQRAVALPALDVHPDADIIRRTVRNLRERAEASAAWADVVQAAATIAQQQNAERQRQSLFASRSGAGGGAGGTGTAADAAVRPVPSGALVQHLRVLGRGFPTPVA